MGRMLRESRVLRRTVMGCAAVISLGCAVQSGTPTRGPEPDLSSDSPGSAPSAPGDEASASPAWTLDDERAGAVTDGVAIVAMSEQVTDGTQQLIVDFDGHGAPPHTTLEHADVPNKLWLTFAGVRIAPHTVPLVTGENSRMLDEPTRTGHTPVISYGRVFYGDDSAIRVELSLSEARPHRMIASENPRRLTIEFQR